MSWITLGTDPRQQIHLTNLSPESGLRRPSLPLQSSLPRSQGGTLLRVSGFGCSARANTRAFPSTPLPAGAATDQPFSPSSNGNQTLIFSVADPIFSPLLAASPIFFILPEEAAHFEKKSVFFFFIVFLRGALSMLQLFAGARRRRKRTCKRVTKIFLPKFGRYAITFWI